MLNQADVREMTEELLQVNMDTLLQHWTPTMMYAVLQDVRSDRFFQDEVAEVVAIAAYLRAGLAVAG